MDAFIPLKITPESPLESTTQDKTHTKNTTLLLQKWNTSSTQIQCVKSKKGVAL